MSLFDASYVLLWLVVIVTCIVVLATLRHVGVIFEALDPFFKWTKSGWLLTLNEPLPDLRVHRADTGEVVKFSLAYPVGSWLMVLDPSSRLCNDLLNAIREEWVSATTDLPQPSLLILGTRSDAKTMCVDHAVPDVIPVFAVSSSKVSESWGITTAPFLLVMDLELRLIKKIRDPSPAMAVNLLRKGELGGAPESNGTSGDPQVITEAEVLAHSSHREEGG